MQTFFVCDYYKMLHFIAIPTKQVDMLKDTVGEFYDGCNATLLQPLNIT